jgi:hypothetical protein
LSLLGSGELVRDGEAVLEGREKTIPAGLTAPPLFQDGATPGAEYAIGPGEFQPAFGAPVGAGIAGAAAAAQQATKTASHFWRLGGAIAIDALAI